MSFPKNVTYRMAKRREPYCTVCNEFLWGNGSEVSPYKCSCGVYESNWVDMERRLVKDTLSKKDAPA